MRLGNLFFMIRVTDVLDYYTEPELLAWMLREGSIKCEKVSAEAKRIGSVVDLIIQSDLRGLSQDTYETLSKEEEIAVGNCLQAWQRFKEDHPLFCSTVSGMQTEFTDGEIVGHPDLEITESSRWGIIDIKTSKAIQPKHWTQVAEYWYLKGKTSQPALSPFTSFIAILRLDKQNARYEYQEITDITVIDYEISVFNAYLAVYQHGQKIREVIRQLREQEMLNESC